MEWTWRAGADFWRSTRRHLCTIRRRRAQSCGAPSLQARSLEQVHVWLILNDSVHCEPVPEEMWQRVLTQEDRISAERKLDQWLVKPTDGIFARMNRRISVPISRQIIKLPITPNVVSLFTLGVGFAAGLLFARGGYWNMLIAAVLSVSASILDGCDGEVARLKLMESDFGCWLETVCDYLYYLFIFAGITIGLWRNSETKTYLVWGGLLLLGAITSFLVTGFGRHRLANGRPEQYLRIWQAKAESRRSNPILYIGRHTEFLIRRCFLPYALLFFAVLNITRVALVLSAVGANLVWLISLYSYRTFVGSRRSPVGGLRRFHLKPAGICFNGLLETGRFSNVAFHPARHGAADDQVHLGDAGEYWTGASGTLRDLSPNQRKNLLYLSRACSRQGGAPVCRLRRPIQHAHSNGRP